MMLKKSDNFTKNELICALECLSEADLRLKKTTQNPKLVLENVLIKICSNLGSKFHGSQFSVNW